MDSQLSLDRLEYLMHNYDPLDRLALRQTMFEMHVEASTSTISPLLRLGLRYLGVWPHVPHSTAYRLIYASTYLIVQYFQYLYVFTHFKLSEILNFADGLSTTLDYTLTIIKMAMLWKHRRAIHEILIAMDNDWHECANVDRHLRTMTSKASISHCCSNTMMSFYTVAGVLYLLGGYTLNFARAEENSNVSLRQFPIQIQFPFEVEQSPVFELIAIFMFVHVMLNAYTLAALNSLIFALVLHASGQIDIICQGFKTISKETSIHGSSVSTLDLLIERHNRVIVFSANIDKILSFMALMQIFWNTLVICCLGLVVIICIHNEDGLVPIIKPILAYMTILLEIFIFCFAGEYLSLKSESVGKAAYDSLWYDMPLSRSKILSLIIMRSQRRLSITAGRIMSLSLEAFASIVKASASYVSVLHAMY